MYLLYRAGRNLSKQLVQTPLLDVCLFALHVYLSTMYIYPHVYVFMRAWVMVPRDAKRGHQVTQSRSYSWF